MNDRILPLIAFCLAIGIVFFYIRPAWFETIATTKAIIASDMQALAAADDYSKQQNALLTEFSAIDPADLDRASAFLPDSVDNVGLILDLNGLAARSGLALANIDVVTQDPANRTSASSGALPSTTNNPVGSVNLSLSATGTFSALQTFLKGVEKSARLLDVQDIVIKGSETGVYTYQMTARLYWLR